VTASLLVLLTVAANCWLPPEFTVALAGETETEIGTADVIITVALVWLAGSSTLDAVIVAFVLPEIVGAVNRPEAEIVPSLADHVTAVLLVLLTVATNCFFPPGMSVALTGETETEAGRSGAGEILLPAADF
jgi:hypothetical protein